MGAFPDAEAVEPVGEERALFAGEEDFLAFLLPFDDNDGVVTAGIFTPLFDDDDNDVVGDDVEIEEGNRFLLLPRLLVRLRLLALPLILLLLLAGIG